MMTFSQNLTVYLYRETVDFRKQINGLSLIVQEAMALDPFSEALFVFTNRSRDRVKVLYWQRNGFCLWLKRLEKDKFCWPHPDENQIVVSLDRQALNWLLEGFDIWKQPSHPEIKYAYVG